MDRGTSELPSKFQPIPSSCDWSNWGSHGGSSPDVSLPSDFYVPWQLTHQTNNAQVQIHALWGNLLVAFAVLRCLTYFFLWLGPPTSILPTRPPTEALGSFFLACGGLVFIFSTEEVTLAAMRRGGDGEDALLPFNPSSF